MRRLVRVRQRRRQLQRPCNHRVRGGGRHVLWDVESASTRNPRSSPCVPSHGQIRSRHTRRRTQARRAACCARRATGGSIGMTIARGNRLEALPIIEAKLHPSRPRAARSTASRIVDRLLDPDAPTLVTLAAPAGYGKTTVLAQWVARERRPVAWLTVDAADNDPTVFVAYLASVARPHRRRRRARSSAGRRWRAAGSCRSPCRVSWRTSTAGRAGRARDRRRAPADRPDVARRARDVREPSAARASTSRSRAGSRRGSPSRACAPSARCSRSTSRRSRSTRWRRQRSPPRPAGRSRTRTRRRSWRGPRAGRRASTSRRSPMTGSNRRAGWTIGGVRRGRADRRLPPVGGRPPHRRRRHDRPDAVGRPRAAGAAGGRGRHRPGRRRGSSRGARRAEPVHPGRRPRRALVPLPQAPPGLPARRARAPGAGHDRRRSTAPPRPGPPAQARSTSRSTTPSPPATGRTRRSSSRRTASSRSRPATS